VDPGTSNAMEATIAIEIMKSCLGIWSFRPDDKNQHIYGGIVAKHYDCA
jgi:hypothetical protein